MKKEMPKTLLGAWLEAVEAPMDDMTNAYAGDGECEAAYAAGIAHRQANIQRCSPPRRAQDDQSYDRGHRQRVGGMVSTGKYETNQELVDNVVRLRANKMTLREIASEVGVSDATISKICTREAIPFKEAV